MGTRELKQFCELDETAKGLIQFAMSDLNLSARTYDRILKVAHTIADLADSEGILPDHVSEAIQYRSLDRQIFGDDPLTRLSQILPGRRQAITLLVKTSV
jgi:magnesium chelatase family protein